jgi:hypothetical protein
MIIRGWQGALMYWLHIAGSAAWLSAGLGVCYILFKYGRWVAVQ